MKLLLSSLSISMPPLKRFIQELVTRIKSTFGSGQKMVRLGRRVHRCTCACVYKTICCVPVIGRLENNC